MRKQIYVFTAAILLTTSLARGQDVLYIRDALTIQNGAQIYVSGGVHATAGAVIFDDGEMYLKEDGTPGGEDFTNDAGTNLIDLSSTGSILMVSTGAQDINGSFVTTLKDLTLSGTSTKTLMSDTKVSGLFNVGNAVLDLNNHTLYILNDAAGAMTSGTGYILSEDAAAASKVIWTIGTTTGAHIVPFGTPGGTNIPVTLNNVSGDKGDVTFATYGTPQTNLPWPATVTNLNYQGPPGSSSLYDDADYVVDRFWKIDPSASAGTADLTIAYDNGEATSLSAGGPFYIQRWDNAGGMWDNFTLDGTQTWSGVSHTVEADGLSNVGKWWAATNTASPLPVQLAVFTGWNKGNKNQLQWKTKSELNASHFELERSADAVNFTKIGEVEANGTTAIEHIYNYDDNAPLSVGYYRLKSVDVGGHVAYSNVVMLRLVNTGLNIVSLYPNPSSSNIHLDIQSTNAGSSVVTVTDILGRVMMTETKDISSGLNQFQINTNTLSAATYFVHIVNNGDGSSVTDKFIKLN